MSFRALRARLSWRLTALGLAQLAVFVIAGLVTAVLTRPPSPLMDVQALAQEAAELGPRDTAALRRLAAQHHLDLTLYDEDSVMRATSIEPPLPLPASVLPVPADSLRAPPPGAPAWPPALNLPPLSVRIEGTERTLVVRPSWPRTLWHGPLITLLIGIVVMMVGGSLTARWLVRPLEALASTAQALGEGQFSARTGLNRDDEIGRVGRAVDEMAQRIGELLRAERELLANVSHELRTPLARIRVAMELATDGDPEAAKAALTDIAVDLAELETIVDDVLAAMRLEVSAPMRAGLPLSALAEVPAITLVDRAVERFCMRHPQRAVQTECADPALQVRVDRVLFRRVIENLLENAHRYSSDASAEITVRVSEEATQVRFEVIDRGIGIDAADLARIFEPFFRAERSRTREEGGVGLGLTLVRHIVDAHGGEVHVESELNRGTTVSVTLARVGMRVDAGVG